MPMLCRLVCTQPDGLMHKETLDFKASFKIVVNNKTFRYLYAFITKKKIRVSVNST